MARTNCDAAGRSQSLRRGAALLICALAAARLLGGDAIAQEPAAGETAENPAQDPAENAGQDPAFEIALPVLLDGRQLAPVRTRATAQQIVELSPSDLANAIEGRVSEEAMTALQALAKDADDEANDEDALVAPAALEEIGMTAALDPATLSVSLVVDPALRASDTVSFAPGDRYEGLELLAPSNLAFGVTTSIFGGKRFEDDPDDGGDDGFVGLFVDGFANVFGREGVTLDFGVSSSFSLSSTSSFDDFTRERVTLFHDDVETEIRYSVGDVTPTLPRLVGDPEFVGASVERRFGVIEPGRTVRATGDRSIFLERRARVEIVVNGVVTRQFVAGPGAVDVTDIPFTGTTNDVEIVVEDGLGRRTIDSFSFGSDRELLKPGLFEFSVAGGVARDAFDNSDEISSIDFATDVGAIVAARYGLTSQLTTDFFIAGGEQYLAGGGGFVIGAGLGVFGVDLASSFTDDGAGFAVDASYVTDFTGLFGQPDQFSLSGEYRSSDFAEFAEVVFEPDEALRARSILNTGLTDTASASLGASFRRQTNTTSREDSVEVSLGVSERFGPISVSAIGSHLWRDAEPDELRGFLGVSYSFGPRTQSRATYDTANNRAVAEVRRSAQNNVGGYGYTARLERDDEDINILGSGDYVGNRYRVELSAERLQPSEDGAGTEVSGRFQTGLAFAGGRLAIGRDPGRGFVIVDTHESLSDSRVAVVGSQGSEDEIAHSDFLGPAVAPIGSSHRIEQIDLAFDDVPTGYDLGEGAYIAQPGAVSGFAIEVGGDANKTIVGTLYFRDEPVGLKTGDFTALDSAGRTDDAAQVFFTNRAGRFALTGVASGAYELRVDRGRYVAVVEIVDDEQTYINIGRVELSRR